MDNFYMIINKEKDADLMVSSEIQRYLEARGKRCVVNAEGANDSEHYRYTNPNDIPQNTECVLVIGGDGTLIQAAHDISSKQIPLLGVNFGTLGYLAEVEKQNIESALEKLIRGEYTIEERMMLSGNIQRKSGMEKQDVALNDIVISRSGALRVINFRIYVNGEFLSLYSADGMIVATPTGSTAYSLSAGGPIVSPNADLIVLTPICPHTFNGRSIVLSANDTIRIELCPDRGENGERMVSFDGDNSHSVLEGDIITIKRAERKTGIVRLNKRSFLETLRNKFQHNM